MMMGVKEDRQGGQWAMGNGQWAMGNARLRVPSSFVPNSQFPIPNATPHLPLVF
ncbi:MAG: hypothetical protein KME30_11235 [Iphinoe sp. HA4291-MV1]|jgi:hypothetical protein|nr:hypothetical protein [Iphinoe sp. HA4291-MV1]